MNTHRIHCPHFGATLEMPSLSDWELRSEFEWSDQVLFSLTRRLAARDGFLKVFLLSVRGQSYRDLADFAGSFPQLSGKQAIPVRLGDREGLLYQHAVRIAGNGDGPRMGIDRHYFTREEDRYTALVVWNSPGLYEAYESEIETIRDRLRVLNN